MVPWPPYSCIPPGYSIDGCRSFQELLEKRQNSPLNITRPVFWWRIKHEILRVLARYEEQRESKAMKAKGKLALRKEKDKRAWYQFRRVYQGDSKVDTKESASESVMRERNHTNWLEASFKSDEQLDMDAYRAEMEAEIVALKQEKRDCLEENEQARRVIARQRRQIEDLRSERADSMDYDSIFRAWTDGDD